MKAELDPTQVAERLEILRRLYVPEHVEDARTRLDASVGVANETFAQAVSRRLAELRALCELSDHLHRGRVRPRLE